MISIFLTMTFFNEHFSETINFFRFFNNSAKRINDEIPEKTQQLIKQLRYGFMPNSAIGSRAKTRQ
jgi:hypothetical protein